MNTFLKTISRLLGVFALTLVIAAAYSAVQATRVDRLVSEATIVVGNEVALGVIPVGSNVPFVIKAANQSVKPARILMIRDSGCGPKGCMFQDPNSIVTSSVIFPITVPPGGITALRCEAIGNVPGDFQRTLYIYTDSPRNPDICVSVQGIVLESGASNSETLADGLLFTH